MLDFEKWLSWQAEVTDAIDREQMELKAYQTMEKMLLVRHERAVQLDREYELREIEGQLIQLRLMQRMKTILIEKWETQFHLTAKSLFN
ncbi:hypothetical protein [Ammoniphilus sp. CFH 90114]|uniref:hypothetical protein n=1 Tax=Ammoniphilus sp. CFH 90114 TaxID=2493665 RepID=UPI00100F9C50|nr:hypothetical protein [Ammoniphilus sp. CFH 90114]RXT04846.1 hypothetical protein EIZ39_19170 [Ammoniphilus sp. CFH 90114]